MCFRNAWDPFESVEQHWDTKPSIATEIMSVYMLKFIWVEMYKEFIVLFQGCVCVCVREYCLPLMYLLRAWAQTRRFYASNIYPTVTLMP